MVELKDQRLLIDGKPSLVLSGEVHYFRLQQSEWQDRIIKAKQAGCNAIASYIPWIIHQEAEDEMDVTGTFRPENNIGAFIDLVHSHGMWFIARPGPFIMAEMKNEGIPFWVYKKVPEAIPVGFHGEAATTKTLDYASPGFQALVKQWYGAIMPVLAARLQPKGGPVIAVQLDNEMGMLSWVSNRPEFTENNLCDFSKWLVDKYGQDAQARYGFDLNDPATRHQKLQVPEDRFAAAFHRDWGDYNRHRIARYASVLRAYAEDHGIHGVPFVVNIHGTGSGRSRPFPIGIHHLYQAYTQAPGYLAGSDFYLGELTRDNAADLYLINAWMRSVNRPEQPLASMEFEVGSGDYGEVGGLRQSSASADFKIRLCAAQGNRLLNYYLMAGGRNPRLRHKVGDGNDRVAFTGERHGFAAPISPEGELDPTYFGLKDSNHAVLAHAEHFADSQEEFDNLGFTFLPDFYKTDMRFPGPIEEIDQALEHTRDYVEMLSRVLMNLCFRYPAVDIQDHSIPAPVKTLVHPSGPLLDADVQTKLADFVTAGGNLFVYGQFPSKDLEGKPCSILADALGIKIIPPTKVDLEWGASVKGEDWASFEPEISLGEAYPYDIGPHQAFMRIVKGGQPCGFEATLGKGKVTVLSCNYPMAHEAFFRRLLQRLGSEPALSHNYRLGGLLLTTSRSPKGTRLLTILNLDYEDKSVVIREHGKALFGGKPISIQARSSQFHTL
jgi:beta-galactosidase